MSADARLLSALSALQSALEALGVPAMITGGIAVIARGVPRQTIDIDATIAAAGLDLAQLFEHFAHYGMHARVPDALVFAAERQVLLLRHEPSGTPLEVSLAWLPFEIEALGRASIVDFSGVRVAVATAEDLVVYKTVAWRDRDRSDVERLLLTHGDDIDLARVRRLVAEFAEALEEPERVAAFEALVARVGSLGGDRSV